VKPAPRAGSDMRATATRTLPPPRLRMTDADATQVREVVARAKREVPPTWDFMALSVDITMCHLNGCPLDFAKLLASDADTFLHDLCGICAHIDRASGRLLADFKPECARGAV
jgi:hypothetical protein